MEETGELNLAIETVFDLQCRDLYYCYIFMRTLLHQLTLFILHETDLLTYLAIQLTSKLKF